MKLIVLLFFVCQVAVCSTNFFDFSDEQMMLQRFRGFEARKETEFDRLQDMHIFDTDLPNTPPQRAIDIASNLISSMCFESGLMWDTEQKKLEDLRRTYKLFYKEYFKKYERGEVSEEVVRYMYIFRRLYDLYGLK